MVYGYTRSDVNSTISIIINNDTKRHNINMPFFDDNVIDLLTGKEYFVKNGKLEIELEPMSGLILQ